MSVKISFKIKLIIIFATIFTIITVFIIESKYFGSSNNNIFELNIAALEAAEDEQAATTDSKLVFEEQTADFGKIPLGEKRIFHFKFVNRYDTPALIQNVKASCDCTEAEWEKQPILPQANSVIKVLFTAKNEGFFSRKISVLDANSKKPIQLIIKGQVILQ
ncbi:MAG: DUF1573 domain-containing protein [Prevotellaceae bacterium]|jgi:hypothetical protein|nr:DUF1573 domain-containing protein [Prevotellaceae bacterium]